MKLENCKIYDPKDFGMTEASEYENESIAILAEINDRGNLLGTTYMATIYCEDEETPPCVDIANAEKVQIDYDALLKETPVFDQARLWKDGTVILADAGNTFVLTAQRNEMLGQPCVIQTENKRYEVPENYGGPVALKTDKSLDAVRSKKLDMDKFNEAVGEKYPALLDSSHIRYGYKYPYFPNAKYYEDKKKTVVFMSKSQLDEISDEALEGNSCFYYDSNWNIEWNINNVYGICVIDDSKPEYEIRLVSPKTIAKQRMQSIDYTIKKAQEETRKAMKNSTSPPPPPPVLER